MRAEIIETEVEELEKRVLEKVKDKVVKMEEDYEQMARKIYQQKAENDNLREKCKEIYRE